VPNDVLKQLRGNLPERRANARTTAALLDNPSCTRRSVLDAAAVDLNRTADLLGAPPKFGQSPFALGQGNRFERRVKAENYALLVEVLRRDVGYDLPDQLKTFSTTTAGVAPGEAALEARVQQTKDVLARIAGGDDEAPNVIDHGVTILHVGDTKIFLEQDALAFKFGDEIQICEIKGFPIVDGSAEPEKVGAAARQSAVYLASLQDTLEELGADPGLVSADVVLICTRNYGLQPTAHKVNVERELRALRRQLSRKDHVVDLLQDLGVGELVEKLGGLDDEDLESRAEVLVSALPMNFVPRCISDCDMARVCRSEAEERGEPGRLGSEVDNLVAGIGDIRIAKDIADGAEPPEDGVEVGIVLRRAKSALAATGELGGAS
jgi:hypothetical protein